MTTADDSDLARFMRGETDPRTFAHREHVRMAFEMLRRYDFATAALHYSHALRLITEKIGKPEKFHQTVTIAFLAIIAERLESSEATDFETFIAAHPDLESKATLARWYGTERLNTAAARRTFLLPDPLGSGIIPHP
jgi:hypothetical protein